MELQPIVGTACAVCQRSILVDLDGKNCKRCGLAIHRGCGKRHREACANKPALAAEQHDYDEVPALRWTARLVVLLTVGAFVVAMGLGMLTARLSDSAPAGDRGAARGVVIAVVALVVGAAMMVGGYLWERGQQRAAQTTRRRARG